MYSLHAHISARPRRHFAAVVVFVIICSLLWIHISPTKPQGRLYHKETPSFFPPLGSDVDSATADLCSNFPTNILDSIQVVLKTGIGEVAKTEAHLQTITSCFSNIIVFSDVEQTVAGRKVHDVLALLPQSYSDNNPDFETYHGQRNEYKETGHVAYSTDGWKLDRFKFLPMVEHTYRMRPKASWYVFLETDTYFQWDVLFRLLHQLDPKKPHYLGHEAAGREGVDFGYGGSGYVISKGLMKLLNEGHALSLSAHYEKWVKDDCCGDAVLAYAIQNRTNVRLEGLLPMFNGNELPFLPTDEESWCIPLMTFHRIGPEMMHKLWRWERTRPETDRPFVHADMLDFILPDMHQTAVKLSWDNHSDRLQDGNSTSHASASACETACWDDVSCLQFSFREAACYFHHQILQGHATDNSSVVSGWDVEKLYTFGWTKDRGAVDYCNGKTTWVTPFVRGP